MGRRADAPRPQRLGRNAIRAKPAVPCGAGQLPVALPLGHGGEVGFQQRLNHRRLQRSCPFYTRSKKCSDGLRLLQN